MLSCMRTYMYAWEYSENAQYVTAINMYEKCRASSNLTKKEQHTPVRWREQGWTRCPSYNHSLGTHLNSRYRDTPIKKCFYIGSKLLFWEDEKSVRMLWEHWPRSDEMTWTGNSDVLEACDRHWTLKSVWLQKGPLDWRQLEWRMLNCNIESNLRLLGSLSRLFYLVHRDEYDNNIVHIKKARKEPVWDFKALLSHHFFKRHWDGHKLYIELKETRAWRGFEQISAARDNSV